MRTIEIVMVAPSRVGKTSLIAAMYEYIKPAFEKTQCYIEPVDNTVNELQRLKTGLYEMFEESNPVEFRGGGIAASSSRRDYKFRIGKRGKNADLEIVFIDLPGGVYTTEDPDIKKQVDEILKRALVTFIPIDTAALFAGNDNGLGVIHQRVNEPVMIKSLYDRVFNTENLVENKLVFITPVKCEKYMQQPNGTEIIFQKICDDYEYKSLLNLFTSDELKKSTDLIFSPVETLGGIHVTGTVKDEYGNLDHILKRVGSYAPHNCHLPLSYLFYYILRMVKDQKNQNILISWFRNLFQMNAYLEQSIEILTKDLLKARKDNEIFILQSKLPQLQNKSIHNHILL
jgi:hypothetical protein